MIELRHFEEVLKVERKAINERRTENKPAASRIAATSPDRPARDADATAADADNPDYEKTRPRPVPCDATGLAFSGGGIRSAAVCLGALQALHRHRRIEWIDYLSTVSGGGYIGCCLSAAMSERGGGTFPFGEDVSDSRAVAHLRNYSNYLMPRGRSAIKNLSDVLAIIIRGVLANIVLVLATLLLCALITWAAKIYSCCTVFSAFSAKMRSATRLCSWPWSWLSSSSGRCCGLTLGWTSSRRTPKACHSLGPVHDRRERHHSAHRIAALAINNAGTSGTNSSILLLSQSSSVLRSRF